jgi:hypothetical protein
MIETYYAQAVETIIKHFPEISFKSCNGFIPLQAEGKIFGKDFYFRIRHEHASLTVGFLKKGAYIPEGTTVEKDMDNFIGNDFAEEFQKVFIELMKTYLTEQYTHGI